MPKENEVQSAGRVQYIEPNNLFINSDGDAVQNGIPQPYEDYSFSVNLRVINGDRYDCGMTGDGSDITKNVLEYSSDKGTLSFMDGTSMPGQQGYLTTNFTDISMNDPSTNTKECLGIESISIKYDSWYYPTVDIRFVDVRGASLMQPAEYEYYNNGNPNLDTENRTKAVTNSDFFKAFFSFPYPLFKLSVKGFYGKEITYDLSVLKCNVEFNSNTGNFEVNASFIGYMYGMYADLPFPFAYIAPYINLYGKNTWEEKKGTGDFCYLTTDKDNPVGIPMYTFPELKRAVENASQEAQKEIQTSPKGEKRIEVEKLIQKLEKEVEPSYALSSKNYTWWSWSKTNTKENQSGYFFISLEESKETNRKIFEDFLGFATKLNDYDQLTNESKYYKDFGIKQKDIFEGILNEVNEIKETRTNQINEYSASTISSDYTDEEIKNVLAGYVVSLAFHKDIKNKENPVLVFDEMDSNFGRKTLSDFSELIDELKRRFAEKEANTPMQSGVAQKNWTIRAIKIDDIKYKETIVDTLNKLKKEKDALELEFEQLRDLKVEDALGFKPSMRNMYNMIFAHIDTFMSTFYNTLDRIRQSIQSSDESRKYETLCGGGIQVDVNENTLKNVTSNGGKLPPFTMFYKEEPEKDSEDRKISMIWPGNLNGGDKLDEVKLVEAIINATSLESSQFKPVTPKNNQIYREGDLAPINYYDLVRSEGNPYLDIINERSLSDEEIIRQILRAYTLRCFYSMLNGSYVATSVPEDNDGLNTNTANYTKKARLIANLEVGNIERAFEILGMVPSQNFVNQLMRMADDGNTLVSAYLTGNNPLFKSSTNGDLTYVWFKNTDESAYKFPIGTFNKTILDNNVTRADTNKEADKFIELGGKNYTAKLYTGGKKFYKQLTKYSTGDFVNAARLFPNSNSLPKSISGITFEFNKETRLSNFYGKIGNEGSISFYPVLPSYRKSSGGITSIFMDPLYYSQTSPEARAYLFLLGIPYGKNKDFFIPESLENGDYPTLMLLRVGAVLWRKNGGTINYGYIIDTLPDIEANDPCLGKKYVDEFIVENIPEGERELLINYFLKFANGGGDTAPATILNLQTIEKYFALWRNIGGTQQLLTSNDCVLVTTAPEVNSFDCTFIKEIYNVSSNGNLGKLNGNLRTDVFINPENAISESTKTFLNNFKKLYFGFDTVVDYSVFDNGNQSFTVPRNAMNDALSAFIGNLKEYCKITDRQLKENSGVDGNGKPQEEYKKPMFFNSDDLKLACYMALKNLYDRWLCSRRRESWYFSCIPERMKNNGIKSDFLRFFYIDEFYHNIGMQVRPNLTNFAEMTSDLGGFTEKSKEDNLAASSIMKVLSTTAQYGGCALLSLPTMLGLARTYTDENNSIAEVFKAYPYNEAVRTNNIETSFVVLYSNQKSSILDIPDDKGKIGYKTDGFDIANTWGKIVPQTMFTDGGEDGFVVPCFGVTFAKQNQSYFKNIRLSMEDHQITEFSVRNEVMISYQSNRGPRETAIIGQDLYSVYSNYSYSCNVSMMGDAQITPLMYFQLNNIAMWKGAYLITNVHHNITVQGMETEFTGVRQARPSVPFRNDEIDMPAAAPGKQVICDKEDEEGKPQNEVIDTSEKPLDKINVDNIRDGIILYITRNSTGMSDGQPAWINGTLSVGVYYTLQERVMYRNIARVYEDYDSVNAGRYTRVSIEGTNLLVNEGAVNCIFLPADTDFPVSQETMRRISSKNLHPFVLYGQENHPDNIEAKALYDELYNLIDRALAAKIPVTMIIQEMEGGTIKK